MINKSGFLTSSIIKSKESSRRHSGSQGYDIEAAVVRLTHNGIIAGKVNGHIPAQTPRGSLILKVSIPFDMFETNSPVCSAAPPQAHSTISGKASPYHFNWQRTAVHKKH